MENFSPVKRYLRFFLSLLLFSLGCNAANGELETIKAGAQAHMRYLAKLANAESAEGLSGGPARPAPPTTTLAEWSKRLGAESKRLKGLKNQAGVEAANELSKLLSLLGKMEKNTSSENFNDWVVQANAQMKRVDDKFAKL